MTSSASSTAADSPWPKNERTAAGFGECGNEFVRQARQNSAAKRLFESTQEPGCVFWRRRLPEKPGADQQVLPAAFGGEPAHQARQDTLENHRPIPKRRIGEEREDLVAVRREVVLQHPPAEQWEIRVCQVLVVGQQRCRDGQTLPGGEAARRGGKLCAHLRVRFTFRCLEQRRSHPRRRQRAGGQRPGGCDDTKDCEPESASNQPPARRVGGRELRPG